MRVGIPRAGAVALVLLSTSFTSPALATSVARMEVRTARHGEIDPPLGKGAQKRDLLRRASKGTSVIKHTIAEQSVDNPERGQGVFAPAPSKDGVALGHALPEKSLGCFRSKPFRVVHKDSNGEGQSSELS